MKNLLNYYGFAFSDPKKGLNKKFLKTKKGKKELNRLKKSNQKLKKQLYKKGFDNSECWNLDITIAKFILPRLKNFQKITIGYPSKLKNEKKWNKILNKMIISFELILNDDENVKKYKIENRKKIQKGLKLFAKYFTELWD